MPVEDWKFWKSLLIFVKVFICVFLQIFTRFNPDRFSEDARKSLPSCGFEPFGFAGKRKCPGYRLSYVEASLFISDLVRKFKVKWVEGQVVEPMFGMITKPKEEIWVTVERRT